MIKINLLATSADVVATPREWVPRERRSAIAGAAVFLVTALAIGGYWYYQSAQSEAIETRIAAAQVELERLKTAADLVERTTARRTELTERLGLIERLRLSKRAPVTLLETVSASIPDGLWLLEIEQAAQSVQIDGRATSITAVTDFTEHLQDSGLFERPVEIVSTTTEAIDEVDIVRFVIDAALAGSPADAPATAGAAAAAGGTVPPVPGV